MLRPPRSCTRWRSHAGCRLTVLCVSLCVWWWQLRQALHWQGRQEHRGKNAPTTAFAHSGRAAGHACFHQPASGCRRAFRLARQSAAASSPLQNLKVETLAQDATAHQRIAEFLSDDEAFRTYSRQEAERIVARDQQDEDKLQAGVQLAIDKGVLPEVAEGQATVDVEVLGRSVDEVCQDIIDHIGDAASIGRVLTLEGLSGTGKSTTVARLTELLPNSVTWSNGNIFRALTLLATTYAEQQGCSLEEATSPDNLDRFVKMLRFSRFGDLFDIEIDGLGFKHRVSEVQGTLLREPQIGKNVPLVAGACQGEVINFVADAVDMMKAAGLNVLMEGRQQTLQYVRTPYRFRLVLKDQAIVGERRATQLISIKAVEKLQEVTGGHRAPSAEEVEGAIRSALSELSASSA